MAGDHLRCEGGHLASGSILCFKMREKNSIFRLYPMNSKDFLPKYGENMKKKNINTMKIC